MASTEKFWREIRRRAAATIVGFPLLLTACFYTIDLAGGAPLSWAGFFQSAAQTFSISWTVASVITLGIWLGYKSGWIVGRFSQSKHFWLMGGLSLVGVSLGLCVAKGVMAACCGAPFAMDFGYLAGSLFTGGLISCAFVFRAAYKSSRARVAELERATAESRYETLRAQMQPHFLFNSLNSLASMIEGGSGDAAAMTTRLADLYRHILENSKVKSATLASEVAIIRDYLELEKLRFGKRLIYRIAVSADENAVFVPSLILQTLVENAVKHGISPAVSGGEIFVSARTDADSWTTIEIHNSGAPMTPSSSSAGTGLVNTRERLSLMYGERHEFSLGIDDDGRTVARFRVSGGMSE